MALQGIGLILNAGQFSDLFFNYDHPKRDALYGKNKEGIDHDELVAAVKDDALEFLAVLGIDESERDEMATALADDFQKRV